MGFGLGFGLGWVVCGDWCLDEGGGVGGAGGERVRVRE